MNNTDSFIGCTIDLFLIIVVAVLIAVPLAVFIIGAMVIIAFVSNLIGLNPQFTPSIQFFYYLIEVLFVVMLWLLIVGKFGVDNRKIKENQDQYLKLYSENSKLKREISELKTMQNVEDQLLNSLGKKTTECGKKIVLWQCITCGEEYEDEGDAPCCDCLKVTRYYCESCGDRYEERKEAIECCKDAIDLKDELKSKNGEKP